MQVFKGEEKGRNGSGGSEQRRRWMDAGRDTMRGKSTQIERQRKREKQHTAALSPDFPPACSQTSSFNLFFHRILQRHDQSWEDYNHASISIGFHDVNDEGEREFREL